MINFLKLTNDSSYDRTYILNIIGKKHQLARREIWTKKVHIWFVARYKNFCTIVRLYETENILSRIRSNIHKLA